MPPVSGLGAKLVKQGLSAAHQGYQYQDLVAACVLVRSLVESYDMVIVDRKLFAQDRFDDLEIRSRGRRCRVQVKSHTVDDRRLQLADLTTDHVSTRIDTLVTTCADDASPADEYRLSVTYAAPTDQGLADCLVPDQDLDSLGQGFRPPAVPRRSRASVAPRRRS